MKVCVSFCARHNACAAAKHHSAGEVIASGIVRQSAIHPITL